MTNRLISDLILLKRVKRRTSLTYRLYIDGTWQLSDGDTHTAFGGYKSSGPGVERGGHGLDEFLLSKSIIRGAR